MAYISFKPSLHQSNKLYTGNASTNAITGVGFTPAMSWFKSRSNTNSHAIFDVLRTTYSVSPSNTAAQYSAGGDGFTSMDSDGWTFNGSGGGGGVNASGFTYIGWNWSGGTTSVPSGGSITPSAVSFNTTAGQGVYTYTGNGTGGATIPHGLGKVPTFIMAKKLNSTGSWMVYHKSMGATKVGYLNDTVAFGSGTAVWNSVTPTTTLITIGTDGDINGSSDTFVMYAFCDVPGYFHTTEYKGNGNADGPRIYCGFEPSWLMIKETDSTSGWVMLDSTRPDSNPGWYNVNSNFFQANDTGVESNNANLSVDFLSNGFKVRNSAGDINGNANSYIVMAFAKNPIIGSDETPCVAR